MEEILTQIKVKCYFATTNSKKNLKNVKTSFHTKKIKTVVGYDSRNNSEKLAKIVADIFTANDIHCFLLHSLVLNFLKGSNKF